PRRRRAHRARPPGRRDDPGRGPPAAGAPRTGRGHRALPRPGRRGVPGPGLSPRAAEPRAAGHPRGAPMSRIIAGAAGGLRLQSVPGRDTRPTTDRVKESLFARLEAWGMLRDARVLDLFAG